MKLWYFSVIFVAIALLIPQGFMHEAEAQASSSNQIVAAISDVIIQICPTSIAELINQLLYIFPDLTLFCIDIGRMLTLIVRTLIADNREIFNGIIAGVVIFAFFGCAVGTIIPVIGNIIGAILGGLVGLPLGACIGCYSWMGLDQPSTFHRTPDQPQYVLVPIGR